MHSNNVMGQADIPGQVRQQFLLNDKFISCDTTFILDFRLSYPMTAKQADATIDVFYFDHIPT